MKTYCRTCHAALADGASFCQACGASLAETAPLPVSNCQSCGAALTPGGKFCRDCGVPVAVVAGAAAATPAPVRGPQVDHAAPNSTGRRARKPAHLPQSQTQSAPAAKPLRGLGKPLLGLVVLAVLGLSQWQWIDDDADSFSAPAPEVGRSERSSVDAPMPLLPPARPVNEPYDVTGIEGIVDIETPELETPVAERAFAAAVVSAATRKLPDLKAQAQAGNSSAMTSLALSQSVGLAGHAEPLSAIVLLQRAAAAGDPHAMTMLAQEYEAGIWIAQDLRKAQALRQQAAKAGSRLAQWELQP